MNKIKEGVGELLDGLYSDGIVETASGAAKGYTMVQKYQPAFTEMPHSLAEATGRTKIYGPDVEYGVYGDFFELMDFTEKHGYMKGPLNHITTRMITIPMMIKDYIGNYPTKEEIKIYEDPPLLQLSPDKLKEFYEDYLATAAEKLEDKEELVKRFDMLGRLGEKIAYEIEDSYPAKGSTQAYELFGIFHLFPSNSEVDVTSTSPGVVLPTEADPLRFKDSVPLLSKNLLRPTYFEMLKRSIELGPERTRRYFASRKGTAKNLKDYATLLPFAKEILQGYINLGKSFEIRIGEQDPRMELATLVGDVGVVFSVRDKEQKEKIAHNVTVMNPDLARKYRNVFDEQWEKGIPLDKTDMLDEIVK